MHVELRERHETMTALARSVSRGEILVHYQPIVEIASGRLVALEALARWRRPGHALVSPGGFISLADEIGLMPDIGYSVLREACEQVRSWQRAFPDHADLTVTVNLAPSELHSPALIRAVDRALSSTGLAPERLVLEITESGVMHQPQEALRTMNALRELGVALALDDFGTGHSSLAHVRDFPMDMLKIAQPFIARLPRSDVDATFVETIMRLAGSLDMNVIAEGIESYEQARVLMRMGCVFGQGFLYGEPAGDLGVTEYLSARSLPSAALAA
jgi:EAL domain-containing protein (putative c-di-GMP-specific phosphodiesterase class I)